MSFRYGSGGWRAVALSAALIALVASGAEAATLPASAFVLPVPSHEPAHLLAEEAAAQTQAAESGKPSVLPNVARSLVLPGWGALHAGYRNVGLAFLVADAALWATVAVSAGQGSMRIHSSFDTAQLYAGIDLESRDDEFRKRVSNYSSSDEYNRLVVMREAASLYYGDFASYEAYIDRHSLKGADTWNWTDQQQWDHYRALRKSSERAYQRARFAAAGLIVNRFAAAIVSSRLTPKSAKVAMHEPTTGEGLAFGPVEWTIAASAERPLDFHHRLSWVIPLE
jgi:hypothetical protein